MYSWLYSVADKEEGEREGEGGDGETPQRLQHIQGSGQVLKLHLRERDQTRSQVGGHWYFSGYVRYLVFLASSYKALGSKALEWGGCDCRG